MNKYIKIIQDMARDIQDKTGKKFCEAILDIKTEGLKSPEIRALQNAKNQCYKLNNYNDRTRI